MPSLSQAEVEALLQSSQWRFDSSGILRDWSFADFKAAIAFVNQIAELSESANHHPDIDIRYNKVRLTLVSHDAGGITHRDIRLAKKIDEMGS